MDKVIAINNYLKSYRDVVPKISTDELFFIEEKLTVCNFSKREFLLDIGEVQKAMCYVHKGLLRSYYVDNNGKEVTIAFIKENDYASDYPSFIRQYPSKYCIETLEPSIIVSLPYDHIQDAYVRYKNFELYGRLIAERILVKKQNRIESFLFENAEQRYKRFLMNNGDLLNRISVSHLSSYLGIERPSLSRIRKKIAAL